MYELGIRSVAVYTPDDRGSVHRVKADEAYEVGERGHPVKAYLDVELIVGLARRVKADGIYPGYGFMSEDPRLAAACAEAGHHLRGALGGGAAPGRQQGAARATRRARPGCRSRTRRRSLDDPDAAAAIARGARLPRLREGGPGRRRPRHAPRDGARGAARRGADGDERGGGRVRRPVRLPRAGDRAAAPHRGAGAGRRGRGRRAPLRARLLRPAAPPEGDRARARRRTSTRRCATACARTPSASRAPSATSTRAPWSSSSTARRARTCSSR